MKRAVTLFAALACAACASDLASPFSAVAVSFDTASGQYRLAQVRVQTLTSLRHLSGAAGQVRAGGVVHVLRSNVLSASATIEKLRGEAVLQAPDDVNLAYSVINDIVYPENFASLELLTAYVNIEQSRAAFELWGLPSLPAAPVVAHASLSDDTGASPLGDGELFYPPLATWYLPQTTPGRTQLPVAFNLGATSHALAHQAISQIVWTDAPVPPAEREDANDPDWSSARHTIRSVTEGLADYLGVAVSGDARWFDHSVQQTAAERALDAVRCSTPDMLRALPVSDATAPYDPYPLGAVLAGALWESSQAGVQVQAKGVLTALKSIGKSASAANGQLGLAVVLDAIVAGTASAVGPNPPAGPNRVAALCGLFLDRFAQMSVSALPSCSGVTPTPPPDTCK